METGKQKVAIFDIDGTIFRSSLLIEFNKGLVRAGVMPQKAVAEILDAYEAWVERRGSYDDYISQVVAMHARYIVGTEARYVAAAADLVFLRHRNRVYRYTRDLVHRLAPTHVLLAISGSPIEMVQPFGHYFGFDKMWGTVYEVGRDGRYTGVVLDRRSVDVKHKILSDYLAETGLTLVDSWGVGDTETDVSFLSLVTHPIAFNPTARLRAEAEARHWPVVVERKDVIYELPVVND